MFSASASAWALKKKGTASKCVMMWIFLEIVMNIYVFCGCAILSPTRPLVELASTSVAIVVVLEAVG